MVRRILWFLLALTVIEVVALIAILREFGVWALIFVLGSMAFGAYLLNTLGRNTAERTAKSSFQKVPDQNLASDQIKVISAVFMLLPGPISTMMGLLLLVPGIGRYARSKVKETSIGQSFGRVSSFFPGGKSAAYSDIVEVELVREDPPNGSESNPKISKNSGE